MFLAYPFMALASLFMAAVTWLFAPLLAKTVDKDGNLPRALRWFQTFDATCFEGRQPQYGMTGTDQEVAAQWLRRNPGYGFDYWPLGCAFDPSAWRVVTDRSDGSLFVAIGPGGCFCAEGKFGLRFKFGWKALNMWDRENMRWKTAPWGPEWRIPICFTVSR